MQSFFNFINGITLLSGEAHEALAASLERMELPKGHQLLRPGAVCHYLYFIERGLTRTWYIKDGKEVTDWISAEDSVAVSIISFLTHQPDRRGIELLEDSVFYALS